jgi:hypothetical protein
MPYNMNKERLNNAINTITDFEWSPLKLFDEKSETTIQPMYITRSEAFLLKAVGKVIPEKIMPFVVRMWGGPEGEEKFKEIVAQMINTPLE